MNIAAVWVASGANFIAEACASAKSFKAHHASVDTHLLTPDLINRPAHFNHIISVTRNRSLKWYHNCVQWYQLLPDLADHIFLFDTDTHICAPLDNLTTLLSHFEFLGCHAPGRHTTGTLYPNLQDEFPEVNIGFIAFKSTPSVRVLLKNWLYLYNTNPDTYGNNDQGPLRDALLQWNGSLYILPPEYNFRFQFGGQVRNRVRVLHGRSKNIVAAASRINKTVDIRSYHRGEF